MARPMNDRRAAAAGRPSSRTRLNRHLYHPLAAPAGAGAAETRRSPANMRLGRRNASDLGRGLVPMSCCPGRRGRSPASLCISPGTSPTAPTAISPGSGHAPRRPASWSTGFATMPATPSCISPSPSCSTTGSASGPGSLAILAGASHIAQTNHAETQRRNYLWWAYGVPWLKHARAQGDEVFAERGWFSAGFSWMAVDYMWLSSLMVPDAAAVDAAVDGAAGRSGADPPDPPPGQDAPRAARSSSSRRSAPTPGRSSSGSAWSSEARYGSSSPRSSRSICCSPSRSAITMRSAVGWPRRSRAEPRFQESRDLLGALVPGEVVRHAASALAPSRSASAGSPQPVERGRRRLRIAGRHQQGVLAVARAARRCRARSGRGSAGRRRDRRRASAAARSCGSARAARATAGSAARPPPPARREARRRLPRARSGRWRAPPRPPRSAHRPPSRPAGTGCRAAARQARAAGRGPSAR